MANNSYLTKSKFTHCLECPTKLYYKNHPEEYVCDTIRFNSGLVIAQKFEKISESFLMQSGLLRFFYLFFSSKEFKWCKKAKS